MFLISLLNYKDGEEELSFYLNTNATYGKPTGLIYKTEMLIFIFLFFITTKKKSVGNVRLVSSIMYLKKEF